MMLDLNMWGVLAARILTGSGLVLLIAVVLRRFTRRGSSERRIWQAALVMVGIFTVAELGGVNLGEWVGKRARVDAPKPMARVTVSEGSREVAPQRATEQSKIIPVEVEEVEPVLWPAGVWLGGFALLMALRLFQTGVCTVARKCSKALESGAVVERVRALTQAAGMRREVKVHQSSMYKTPVAFGIWSAGLGLPDGFEQEFSPEEQEAILAHEVVHLANGDGRWMLLADLVCAACWWNPAGWLLRRNFLDACELAADEESARLSNGEVLAEALVAVASRMRPGLAGNWSGMAGRGYRSNLGRRVSRLMDKEQPVKEAGGWTRMVATGVSVVLFALGLVAVGMVERQVFGMTLRESPIGMVWESWQEQAETHGGSAVVTETPPTPKVVEVAAAEAPAQKPEEPPIDHEEKIEDSEPPRGEKLVVPQIEVTANSSVDDSKTIEEEKVPEQETKPEAAPVQPAAGEVMLKLDAKWIEVAEFTTEDLRKQGLEEVTFEANASTRAGAKLIAIEGGEGWITNDLPGAKLVGPLRVVLTDEQAKKLIERFETMMNLDLLSAPKITTLSGREARISILDTQTIVTGIETNELRSGEARLKTEGQEFGTMLDVVAQSGNEGVIGIEVKGRTREFLGYSDGPPVVYVENGRKKKQKLPLPKIQERYYETEASVENGETVLLAGITVPVKQRYAEKVPVLGDVPLLGRLFRSQGEQTVNKHLLLMVKVERVENGF